MGVREQHIYTSVVWFERWGFRLYHEMEDSSEGEESMDEDVFED